MTEEMSMSYTPLGKVLGTYQDYLVATSGKKKTVSWGRCMIGQLLDHFGEDANVEDMATADVEGFIATRAATGVSRSTINGNLRMLRQALRRAVADKVLVEMPCRVKPLRVGKKIPRVISQDDVKRLLAAARHPWVRAVIALAAYAGLRHQEILHLQRRDIDFDAGEVRVSSKGDWTPKSHCEREVPMAGALERELRRHLADVGDDPDAWVFLGYEGTPRHEATLDVRETFVAAGLYDPKTKPGLHQLRRTWATALCEHNDIETVRELGGWADLVTVQKYVSSNNARKRRAIALFDEETD